MDADAKKTALRMIPYGLYVLTACGKDGRMSAATVNWVTQTAFAPPLIAVGVKADSLTHALIEDSGEFVLNVIAKGDNGLAYAATALYTGMVPTVMSNGSLSYVTIPLVVGAGLPISPASFLTITPWAEVSPSLNVDAFVDTQKLTTEVTNLANETVNQVATTTAHRIKLRAETA